MRVALRRYSDTEQQAFETVVERLSRRGDADLGAVDGPVREIISAVRREGDAAVRRYVTQFERRSAGEHLFRRDYGGAQALEELAPPVREAMVLAERRIRAYHERQAEQLRSFEYVEDGIRLGSRVTPLERVGVYAPGGKARYPSSVLMTAVVARVAGVREIVVASPDISVELRAACHLAQVDGVLDAGGAQAIAALAYGTQSVPRMDKIVGPGNIYVAAAKRLVFGEVSIDSIAGPSEILVVADESADPAVVAADLLSQAEHDEAAYPLLLTSSAELADRVDAELERQLSDLPRREIARKSIDANGYCLVVSASDSLAGVANRLAVEHVAVQTRDAALVAAGIERAGALFIGAATPEAAGDYLAGPSHVLPTGGAVRFSSPVGVYDFVSRSSLIEYSQASLRQQAAAITSFARAEGLEGHARAVEVRMGGTDRA